MYNLYINIILEEDMIKNLHLYNNTTFSRIESTFVTNSTQSNIYNNIHGGDLMKLMDNTTGVAAVKHCKGFVMTAKADDIIYHNPVPVGSIITVIGQLVYVGTSSLIVLGSIVKRKVEDYDNPQLICTGVFTMVHIKDNKPAEVPKLVIENQEDEELYAFGEILYKEIKERNKLYK